MADESHTESVALRVQFDTPEQQKDASTLGMWIFLITEVMFFGGMFLVYTVYRRLYPDVFALASGSLNAVIGAINTGVLLFSSFTMVMAVRERTKSINIQPASECAVCRGQRAQPSSTPPRRSCSRIFLPSARHCGLYKPNAIHAGGIG